MEAEDGALYISKIYLSIIGKKEKKPKSMQDKEWEILDRKELGTIRFCLVASVAFNISKEKTTTYMMNALAKLYEKPSTSNKVFLMKHLFNMKI